MKFWDKVKSWFDNMARERQISVQDNGTERWRAEISPLKLTAIGVGIVAVVFVVLLLLVAYTPLLDLLPGYRTSATKAREMLIRNIVRTDSLERRLNEMLIYNENRILVVGGKTPAMQSSKNDSLQHYKEYVAPSKEDSLLRRKMENDERYRPRKSTAEAKND